MKQIVPAASASDMVVLRDGSSVPWGVLITTRDALLNILKENPCAVYDFARRCKDPNYRFVATAFGDPQEILVAYDLMRRNGDIPYWVEKSVLNLLNVEGGGIDFIDPRRNRNPS